MAFAAETHDALDNARGKLVRKRADLIVVNEVGADKAFGTDDNAATVLGADGSTIEIGLRRQRGRWPTMCGIWSFAAAVTARSPLDLDRHVGVSRATHVRSLPDHAGLMIARTPCASGVWQNSSRLAFADDAQCIDELTR